MTKPCRSRAGLRTAFIGLGLAAALTFDCGAAASQDLSWENRGQAAFGGFFLDAAAQGRVLVTSGSVFDEEFRYRWFVRAHDGVTGATLWEDELDPEIALFDGANEVAVDQGRAFAAGFILREETGYVFVVRAYDLKTGAVLWDQRVSRVLGADTAKVVAAGGGRVFVGGYLAEEAGGFNFAVLAFDGRTGALLWESVLDSGGHDAAWSIALAGNRVFAAGDIDGGRSLVIRAHVADTGAVAWENRVSGASNFYAEEDALDVHGRLVFAAGILDDGDFVVRAYAARSGDLQWSARVEAGHRISQGVELASANGRLFVAGVLDCDPESFVECKLTVHAYDAATGAFLWRDLNQSPGNDWYVSGLAAGAGRVYVGGARLSEASDYTPAIRAYDAKTGRLTWEDTFDGGGNAFQSVYDLFLDRGRLFALGQLSSPDKHSDAFLRAYAVAGGHGRKDDEARADEHP